MALFFVELIRYSNGRAVAALKAYTPATSGDQTQRCCVCRSGVIAKQRKFDTSHNQVAKKLVLLGSRFLSNLYYLCIIFGYT